MANKTGFSKQRFCGRYISVLNQHNIKVSTHRWYVNHIETYLKYYPDIRLQQQSAKHVETYLKEIDRKENIKPFQFWQIIDALRLLFCHLLGAFFRQVYIVPSTSSERTES